MPSKKVATSKAPVVARPKETNPAKTADTTTMRDSTRISSHRESMTSASAPAGKVNRNKGRLTAT